MGTLLFCPIHKLTFYCRSDIRYSADKMNFLVLFRQFCDHCSSVEGFCNRHFVVIVFYVTWRRHTRSCNNICDKMTERFIMVFFHCGDGDLHMFVTINTLCCILQHGSRCLCFFENQHIWHGESMNFKHKKAVIK